MGETLLPCPFCGSDNISSGGDDKIVGYWCLDCQANGPNHYGRHEWNTRAAITPAMAAEVLLNGVPNPIFDNLKYPLSGEFKVSCFGYDEDGADAEWEVTVGWPTIKDIIRAALTAIKESKDD